MEKMIEAIENPKYLIASYVLAMLYIRDVLIDVFQISHSAEIWNGITVIVATWTTIQLILLFLHKKLYVDKTQALSITFMIVTCISTLFIPFRPEGNFFRCIIWYFLMVFSLYQSINVSNIDGNKDITVFLIWLFRQVVIVFLVLNVFSVFLFITYKFGITFPGFFDLNGSVRSYLSERLGVLRYHGLYEGPTDCSYRCSLSIFLSLFLFDRKEFSKWFTGISVVMSVSMIQLSNCRGTLLGLVCAIVYAAFLLTKNCFPGRKGKSAFIVIVIIGFMVFVGTFVYKYGYLINLFRVNYTEFRNVMHNITSLRYFMWESAIETWKKYPLFGWGWTNAPVSMFERAGVAAWITLHNFILDLLVWTGVVGLILFLGVLVVFTKRIWNNRAYVSSTKSGWLVAFLGSVIIQALFNPGLIGENSHIESLIFWLICGYLLYLPASASNSLDKTVNE